MPEFLETTIDKFIFRVATDRLYSRDGVWVLESGGDGRVRLGLSDYVQQRNGDAAFVHLKPIGARLSSGDEFAELETIKATLSLISPLAGELIERAGLKGTRIGGAVVNDRHANFIVAEAEATSSDVLRLIDLVRDQVCERLGIELELELEVW